MACQLTQLRDALAEVNHNTEKYKGQCKKSPALLTELTKSLTQLKALQLRSALADVKNNTDRYIDQSQKSPALLANLTNALKQLNALNPSNEVKS